MNIESYGVDLSSMGKLMHPTSGSINASNSYTKHMLYLFWKLSGIQLQILLNLVH